MDWAKPKAAAKLALADSGAAEMAFFLALSLVPFVGLSIALVSRWIRLDLSASIEEVLRGVLPTESHADVGEMGALGALVGQPGVADGRVPVRAVDLLPSRGGCYVSPRCRPYPCRPLWHCVHPFPLACCSAPSA